MNLLGPSKNELKQMLIGNKNCKNIDRHSSVYNIWRKLTHENTTVDKINPLKLPKVKEFSSASKWKFIYSKKDLWKKLDQRTVFRDGDIHKYKTMYESWSKNMHWDNLSFENFDMLFIKPADTAMEAIICNSTKMITDAWQIIVEQQNKIYEKRKESNDFKRKREDGDIVLDSKFKSNIDKNLLFIKPKSKKSKNPNLLARSTINLDNSDGLAKFNRTIIEKCVTGDTSP